MQTYHKRMQVPAGAMAVQQMGGAGAGGMGGAGLVEPESQLSPSNPGLVAATQRGSPCPPHTADVPLGQELDGVYRYTITNTLALNALGHGSMACAGWGCCS